jgi:GNAT superfamily N-acetyltransferase
MPQFAVIDMRDSLDHELLSRFYDEIMIPNFPLEDELDDLELWFDALTPEAKANHDLPKLHVVIWTDIKTGIIAGGHVVEYYPRSTCGLISYFAVSSDYRGLGLGRRLIENGVEVLDSDANHCIGANCSAIFAETNARDIEDGVLVRWFVCMCFLVVEDSIQYTSSILM